MILIYSAAHFIIDFACAFLMFRSIAASPDWHLCILLYNFCAFAMQMPLGIIADKLNRNYIFAAAGCILAGAAYGFAGVPAASVIILGIGNGMFHIGGGIDVLNISGGKSGALGIFVSPGALGLYFGAILGKASGLSALPVLLAFASAALIIAVHKARQSPDNAAFSLGSINQPHIFTAIICLFLVVCLRSYTGLTLDFPWKGSVQPGLILACAAVLGKIAGGFAADKFGAAAAAFLSLSIAGVLFLFPGIPAAGTIAVLLFNMTMPVTLWAMAEIFPGAKGFAFGLLTFALFIGFVPVYLDIYAKIWLLPVSAAVSLILLLIGLRKADI